MISSMMWHSLQDNVELDTFFYIKIKNLNNRPENL